VESLQASWENTGALLSDGAYYDWGINNNGQLGDGSVANSATPVKVELRAAVTQVSEGGSDATNGQTIAVLSDGSIWAWGSGRDGQLGDGKTSNETSPVQVEPPAGVDWVSLNAQGGYDAYAIDSHGNLWAWGLNSGGQLGNGTNRGRQLKPAKVTGLSNVTTISSTSRNVAALAQG
jgi:alpha-tubulin suppressor-like RCC1 family protein